MAERETWAHGARTFEAFGRAGASDKSIDLESLGADAAHDVMQELGTAMGFETLPRIEEVGPGVILCHPLAAVSAVQTRKSS